MITKNEAYEIAKNKQQEILMCEMKEFQNFMENISKAIEKAATEGDFHVTISDFRKYSRKEIEAEIKRKGFNTSVGTGFLRISWYF